MACTARRRQQIGLPALLAGFALLALWFGGAETVGKIIDRQGGQSDHVETPPLVVFQRRSAPGSRVTDY